MLVVGIDGRTVPNPWFQPVSVTLATVTTTCHGNRPIRRIYHCTLLRFDAPFVELHVSVLSAQRAPTPSHGCDECGDGMLCVVRTRIGEGVLAVSSHCEWSPGSMGYIESVMVLGRPTFTWSGW